MPKADFRKLDSGMEGSVSGVSVGYSGIKTPATLGVSSPQGLASSWGGIPERPVQDSSSGPVFLVPQTVGSKHH